MDTWKRKGGESLKREQPNHFHLLLDSWCLSDETYDIQSARTHMQIYKYKYIYICMYYINTHMQIYINIYIYM